MCDSAEKADGLDRTSAPRTIRTFSSVSDQEGSKRKQTFTRTKTDNRRTSTSTITLVVDDGSEKKLLAIEHARVYEQNMSGFYSQTVLNYEWNSNRPDTYIVNRKYAEQGTATGQALNTGNSGEQKFLRGFDPNAVLVVLNGDDENDIERFLVENLPPELGLQYRG